MAVSALRFAEWWQKWHDVDDEEDPNRLLALKYITEAEDELMSDCSGLATALQSLATALQAGGGLSGARGGGGGCQGIMQCLTGYTDDQLSDAPAPGVNIGGNTPPDGFDTMEAYRTYKCQAAEAVVDMLKGLFSGLSGMTGLIFATDTIGPAVIALLSGVGVIDIVFPPAAVVTLIAAIVAAGILFGASFWIFRALTEYIEDNRHTLVCSLFISGDAAAAQEAIAGMIEDFMQTAEFSTALGGPESPAGLAFGAVTALMVPNALVNSLFRLVEGVAYPSADCDDCDYTQSEVEVVNDTYDGGGGTIVREGDHVHITATWVATGDPYGQFYHAFFKFVDPENPEAGICCDMPGWYDTLQQVESSSSFLKCAGGYENITSLPITVPEVGVTNVYIRSSSPFFVDFTVEIH
jgi:hypothetical protein